MQPPLAEIEKITRDIVESEGLELVDIEFKSGQSRDLLRIFIEKNGGVTLDDCEMVSRQIGAILDVKDLIRIAYVLEVSSPGIDRPFKTDRDYMRAIGRTVKIQYAEGETVKPLTGKLVQVNDMEIMMEVNGGAKSIPRDQIRKAQQEIVFPAHPKKDHKRRNHR